MVDEAEQTALFAPAQRQAADTHHPARAKIVGLAAIEDRHDDVGSEIAQPRQTGEFVAEAISGIRPKRDQLPPCIMSADDQTDQLRIATGGGTGDRMDPQPQLLPTALDAG